MNFTRRYALFLNIIQVRTAVSKTKKKKQQQNKAHEYLNFIQYYASFILDEVSRYNFLY